MNIEVRYYSRGGNTKKVANAIAELAKVDSKDTNDPIEETIDLLFFGTAVYAFGIDDHVKEFISKLDSSKVKNVALFSTSAMLKKGNNEMAELFKAKGINVVDKNYHCWGSFTAMHRGHPNKSDLDRAMDFASSVINKMK